MDPATLTVLIMAVAATGYFLAKWRRALSDLRKTIASVPLLRKTMRGEAGRLLTAAAIVMLTVYAWVRGQ